MVLFGLTALEEDEDDDEEGTGDSDSDDKDDSDDDAGAELERPGDFLTACSLAIRTAGS